MNNKTTVSLSDNVLQISGVLTFETVVRVLKESLQYFVESRELMIDLAQVEHTDSAALALFCEWIRFAKKKSMSIKFINPPRQLLNIAKISKVDSIIRFG